MVSLEPHEAGMEPVMPENGMTREKSPTGEGISGNSPQRLLREISRILI
jgi:hypothetical protein